MRHYEKPVCFLVLFFSSIAVHFLISVCSFLFTYKCFLLYTIDAQYIFEAASNTVMEEVTAMSEAHEAGNMIF